MKTLFRTSALALAFTTPALLGGCLQSGQMLEPTHRLNPVKVAESVERLELYARPNGLELSARDEYAVTAFLEGYAAQGNGPIYINRPSAAMTGLGVQQTDALLTRLMTGVGISPAATQSGVYHSNPNDPAPVVLSYRTLRAVPQDCGYLGDVGRTYTNGVTPSFGCSASANMAAMISDPRQLIEPYPTDFPNASRRQVVYDQYIQGASTASERPAGQEVSSQDGG